MIPTTTAQPPTRTIVSRSPIFYGWVVWVVASLGMIATAPAQSFTISLFIDRFIEDFALDRTTVSGLYSLGTLVASFALTWVGRQVDRHGNRRMSLFVGVAYGLALCAFSLVAGPLTLVIGFIALRGLGQGSMWLVNSTAIAQWFMRYRGRVLALTLVAFSLFQSVYVPWLQRQLAVMDWRQVWIILGVFIGCVITPLMWLLIRNKPEEYDLKPDGQRIAWRDFPVVSSVRTRLGRPAYVAVEEETEALEDNWTLREAMGTLVFWVFMMGRVVSPAWGTGLILHQVSIFEGLGHTEAIAAETYALISIFTAAISLLAGFVIDRIRPGRVMTLQLAALIAAMLIAMVMREAWLLVAYAFSFALIMGVAGVFDNAVWTNLFGRQYQGEIRGFVQTVLVAGTALGPIVFGLSYDLTGNYDVVLWIGIALAIVPMIWSYFVTDTPQRRVPRPPADGADTP